MAGMIFDLHVHTSLSSCSRLEIKDAVARAKACGLDGICITDHHTMDVRHVLCEGVQGSGVCVIIGMEYSTDQGDFLIFGPFEELPPHLPADLLLRIVKQNNGAAVAAHPFRKARIADPQIIQSGLCHAIESLNGRNTPMENAAVAGWCRCYDLTECGGSDAHTIEEVGTFATRFFVPVRTRSDLIHALKDRLCQAVMPPTEHVFAPGVACSPSSFRIDQILSP